MNKKGFTLVELLAVIILITVVSMLTFPALNNLRNNNDMKKYTTYEDMMVEYAKVIPNYKSREFICLDELGIKKINENYTCNGYVITSSNKAYIKCKDKSNQQVYITSGFTNKGCSDY